MCGRASDCGTRGGNGPRAMRGVPPQLMEWARKRLDVSGSMARPARGRGMEEPSAGVPAASRGAGDAEGAAAADGRAAAEVSDGDGAGAGGGAAGAGGDGGSGGGGSGVTPSTTPPRPVAALAAGTEQCGGGPAATRSDGGSGAPAAFAVDAQGRVVVGAYVTARNSGDDMGGIGDAALVEAGSRGGGGGGGDVGVGEPIVGVRIFSHKWHMVRARATSWWWWCVCVCGGGSRSRRALQVTVNFRPSPFVAWGSEVLKGSECDFRIGFQQSAAEGSARHSILLVVRRLRACAAVCPLPLPPGDSADAYYACPNARARR